jgi:hypothetical protein
MRLQSLEGQQVPMFPAQLTRDADYFDLAEAFRMTFSGIGLAALLMPAQKRALSSD